MTPGDTPLSIRITPNTIHGARPISVKIQPAELPTKGSTIAGTSSASSSRPCSNRSRSIATTAQAASSSISKPAPTITRKFQYVHITGGT